MGQIEPVHVHPAPQSIYDGFWAAYDLGAHFTQDELFDDFEVVALQVVASRKSAGTIDDDRLEGLPISTPSFDMALEDG